MNRQDCEAQAKKDFKSRKLPLFCTLKVGELPSVLPKGPVLFIARLTLWSSGCFTYWQGYWLKAARGGGQLVARRELSPAGAAQGALILLRA